jgi:hypothetical protein
MIGMVLVDPRFDERHRHRAYGTSDCLSSKAGRSHNQIDATPAGQPSTSNSVLNQCVYWSGGGMSTQAIAEVDRPARRIIESTAEFGADRSAILQSIVADAGRPPIVARDSRNQIVGFAMTRPGSRAAYIGPIIAPEIETARSLLTAALAAMPAGPVFIDLHLDFPDVVHLVRQLGFNDAVASDAAGTEPLMADRPGSWQSPDRRSADDT